MISIKELRDALNLDPSMDRKLESYRKSVIALFETKTKRLWNYRTGYTKIFQPSARDVFIYLPLYPIDPDTLMTAAFTITEQILSNTDDSTPTTPDATDYVVDREKGIVQRIRCLDWKQFVTITVNGGFTPETLDATYPQIKQAFVIQIQYMLSRFAPEKIHVLTTSVRRGEFATFLKDSMHPYFVDICSLYTKN